MELLNNLSFHQITSLRFECLLICASVNSISGMLFSEIWCIRSHFDNFYNLPQKHYMKMICGTKVIKSGLGSKSTRKNQVFKQPLRSQGKNSSCNFCWSHIIKPYRHFNLLNFARKCTQTSAEKKGDKNSRLRIIADIPINQTRQYWLSGVRLRCWSSLCSDTKRWWRCERHFVFCKIKKLYFLICGY